jgi:NAD(P)-dependent dehydrogenase (short-subunit alcohol dehydrogenase family)
LTAILKKWRRCDVVIHGVSPALILMQAEKLTYSDVTNYLDVYLKGAISLVNLLSPNMKKNQFGRFVFLGTSALYATPPVGMVAYVSVKEILERGLYQWR